METLKGNHIYLRALEPEDIGFLYKLENTESVWEVSETQVPYSRFLLKEYLKNSHKDIYSTKQLRLVICKLNEEVIGFIDMYDFNPLHQRAGIGIVILEDAERGKGYGGEALQLVCSFGFKHLNLHQLYALIAEDNLSSIKVFENCGFLKSAVKKDWSFSNGKFKNELLYQKINNR